LDASLKFALQEDHPDGCCGPEQVQWVGVCLGRPALFVTTDRQTDTTVAFIYKMDYGIHFKMETFMMHIKSI